MIISPENSIQNRSCLSSIYRTLRSNSREIRCGSGFLHRICFFVFYIVKYKVKAICDILFRQDVGRESVTRLLTDGGQAEPTRRSILGSAASSQHRVIIPAGLRAMTLSFCHRNSALNPARRECLVKNWPPG
jgi:hypothetical protein